MFSSIVIFGEESSYHQIQKCVCKHGMCEIKIMNEKFTQAIIFRLLMM